MKKHKPTKAEKLLISIMICIIALILLAILSSCSPEKFNVLMWGKEGSEIKSITKSCAKGVSKIHVPYEPEPTVCNHDFHYSSQLMCLPKCCVDSVIAWDIREDEIKNKLYEQYLKIHSR